MVDSLRDRAAKVLLEQGHVVSVIDRASVQSELLAEQVQQMGKRVDGGGDEVALDPGDGRLGGTRPIGELLLRQTVAASGLPEEFS